MRKRSKSTHKVSVCWKKLCLRTDSAGGEGQTGGKQAGVSHPHIDLLLKPKDTSEVCNMNIFEQVSIFLRNVFLYEKESPWNTTGGGKKRLFLGTKTETDSNSVCKYWAKIQIREESLPNRSRVLNWTPGQHKVATLGHSCSPSIPKVEVQGGARVQGHPHLLGEFKAMGPFSSLSTWPPRRNEGSRGKSCPWGR